MVSSIKNNLGGREGTDGLSSIKNLGRRGLMVSVPLRTWEGGD